MTTYRILLFITITIALGFLNSCGETPQAAANRIITKMSPKTVSILNKNVIEFRYVNDSKSMSSDREYLFEVLNEIKKIMDSYPESDAAVSFAASRKYGGIDPIQIRSRLLFYPGGAKRFVADEYKPLLGESTSFRSIMWFYASVLSGNSNEYNVLQCAEKKMNVKYANDAIKYLIETAGRITLMSVPWPGNQRERTQIENLALYFIVATKAEPRSSTNQEPKFGDEEKLAQLVKANETIIENWLKLERKVAARTGNRGSMGFNKWKSKIPSAIANIITDCIK